MSNVRKEKGIVTLHIFNILMVTHLDYFLAGKSIDVIDPY